MTLPLEGIRVIDLGQVYAAPYCTLQLAAMGADVIKIEPPKIGEVLRRPDLSPGGVNYSFLMLNANKRSITINLKDRRGQEIVLKLLEDADVLVENFLAGVMESFGLAYDQIAEKFLSITGFPDQPVKTSATYIDMGTGSHLVSGILAALIQRGKTSRGQHVEVAMLDVAIPALTSAVAPVLQGAHFKRLGNRHWGACPTNIYPARDGEILIFCLTEAHWRTLAKLMARADLISDPRCAHHGTRLKIADELDGIVADWTRTQARDEMIQRLIEAGIPCAPVRGLEEVIADPEVAERSTLIESDYPTRGAIRVVGSPIKLSDAPESSILRRRPPQLGEHNAEVLATIGIDAGELERLTRDGVV